jgi:hypothetical protein
MNAPIRSVLLILCLLCLSIGGCSPAAPTMMVQEYEEPVIATEAPAPLEGVSPTSMPEYKGEAAAISQASGSNRLLVKNADITLLVTDTDVAIDRMTQIVTDVNGYIISSRVWFEQSEESNNKYATLTIGVPVDQFERALLRIREIAVRVITETATGEDVTDEYVDLESRLKNLETSRDRIREFMKQANNIDEVLKVNEQLTSVEEDIEKVKGRMNYLFNRSAYSTITIQITPDKPTPAPSPTPTPTPKPIWSAAPVFQQASGTLIDFLHFIIEAGIWIGIVFLPIFGPIAIIIWLFLRFTRKKIVTKPPQE